MKVGLSKALYGPVWRLKGRRHGRGRLETVVDALDDLTFGDRQGALRGSVTSQAKRCGPALGVRAVREIRSISLLPMITSSTGPHYADRLRRGLHLA